MRVSLRFLRLAALVAMGGVALGAAANNSPSTIPAGLVPVNGANTVWMLMATVLVFLMTMPGIMLFYSGMVRTRNTLSVMAHAMGAMSVITIVWCAIGYSLAFSSNNEWIGGTYRAWGAGLIGTVAGAHVIAQTIPEAVFFLFQMAFATIAFCIVLGSTAERMRIGATLVFAAFWVCAVYAPVAHWAWHPDGWLARQGYMDFAGGTVVHLAAGMTGLAAAITAGPRRGFGKTPMVPHNLSLTVLGAGLMWIGWFGFNAGSAFEASARAAGAVLATQVAAGAGALVWSMCELVHRQRISLLGLITGAFSGLIAVTPASGYVGISGALAIGAIAPVACYLVIAHFKARTGIDDTLDVFGLHGIGGFVGTLLTPVFALPEMAPRTASVLLNAGGAVAVAVYAFAMSWLLLKLVMVIVGIRVTEKEEAIGLDLAQHGERAV